MADKPQHDPKWVEQKVQSLVSQLTRDEKADLLCGHDMWHLVGVPRLGIPALRVTDCGHGAVDMSETSSCSTCLPSAVGQASTWNVELIEQAGVVLGRETRAHGCAMLLGPMMNIHRIPLNGRNYETYCEDPYLAGKIGGALVKGIQSQDIGSCIKGFAANNQQLDQHATSMEIDERTLQEIYVTNFRIAAEDAEPWAVMTNYNAVNGIDTGEHKHLITDIIKDQWQFDGFVVCDWRATFEGSIEAGLDLEMPGPGKFMRQEDIQAALEGGKLTKADLDDRVARILRLHVKAGLIDGDTADHRADLNTPEHQQIAQQVGEEAAVLLKNGNAFLPLDQAKIKTLAVIGPNAEEPRLGGGGSASVNAYNPVGPLRGLQDLLGDDVELQYVEGCAFLGKYSVIQPCFLTAPDDQPGLLMEVFRSQNLEGDPALTRVDKQVDSSWGWSSPGQGIQRNDWSARWTGQLTPQTTGRHQLAVAWRTGGVRLYVNDELLIDQWGNPGVYVDTGAVDKNTDPQHAEVALDLTAGESLDIRLEYNKTANMATLRLEWQQPGEIDAIEQAANVAASADAAVVFAGLSNAFEGGNNDRKGMDLPGDQDKLIQAVAAANPHTAVVIIGGTPVAMTDWIDDVSSVLYAWYPGQQGGAALARLLFGQVNPSGKLPDTLARRLEDTPAYENYPGKDGKCHYAEGVFVGYRHYDEHNIEPLFPFGFGLSYTTFEFANLKLSAQTLAPGQTLTASVDITNTGQRSGKEVAQLYISDPEASVARPPRELKGFAKIELQPGETRTVTFEITEQSLAFFDVKTNTFAVEPGDFTVTVGPDSRSGLSETFTYKS